MSRDPKELAKQLGTYADAIVAFSAAQSIVFAFALGEQNTFIDKVLAIKLLVPTLIIAAYLVYWKLVQACHRGEDALLGAPSGTAAVDHWTVQVRHGRTIVIILAAILSLLAICFTIYGAQHS